MKKDAKTTYAQSSDIKSRAYLEYRRDMKRKAIAELEITDWLKAVLEQAHPDVSVEVSKAGGDAFLWFLRKGGVTREPDYHVTIGEKEFDVEFQYAEHSDLPSFDFAVSKIAKKDRTTGNRQPHADRQILYVLKDKQSFALFTPSWVVKNGIIGFVEAWRKSGYRVPAQRFLTLFSPDDALQEIIVSIERKNNILRFQHELVALTKEKLARLLEQVIDEKKLVTFMPNDLESFFRTCFILDNIDRTPANINLWLVYALALLNKDNSLDELYRLLYCVDFLYARAELTETEVKLMADKITPALKRVMSLERKDGSYQSTPRLSPLDETRYALFSVNLLEDMIQDMIHYYHIKSLQPIRKIYQAVKNLHSVSDFIKR